MARTKQFDERQALLTAMLVFWENGYAGTSMQALEDAMGLKRTSIYNAFGNKRQLFNQVITCYKESVLAALFSRLDSTPDIKEGIGRMLNAALDIQYDDDTPGGCLVVLSVLESGQHTPESRASLEQTLRDLKTGLQVRLTKARKAGELPADLDTGSMANTIATTMAGMMVLGKAKFPKTALKKTIRQVVGMLDSKYGTF